MTTKFLILIILMITLSSLHAQVYLEKQTRHRFAQLNMGMDIQSSFGGTTKYLNSDGTTKILDLNQNISPRFLIGGTHFWGHADFYIAIPLYSKKMEKENQQISVLSGVETVFKYYPWRIEHNKIRPYIGTSLSPFFFYQKNNLIEYGNGTALNHTSFPLLGGLTFNSKNHLVEVGVSWNYQNKQDYHISRTQIEKINTPPLYASLSYRYMLETTLSAEKDWESGRTKQVTQILADQGRLNGFYLGAGISSAFWLKQSDYNKSQRPYIKRYDISIMPDFTLGYYLHNSDLNLAVGYRGYQTETSTYGAIQVLNRKSIVVEATKYLGDYHGFVPFVGPAVSYEKLAFKESFEGSKNIDVEADKMAIGLTLGWDIRPNRIQSWILRTNLRWYPGLALDVNEDSKISFDNLEFNFIQLIMYPNRMIPKRRKKNSTT